MRIKGRNVVVTGASEGIGRETALRLARHGANVWAVARNEGRLKSLSAENAAIKPYVCDLTVIARRQQLVNDVGPIDVLVNNAGMGVYAPIDELTERDLRKMFELNYFAVVDLVQRVLPSMHEREIGHIVNVGSIAGYASFSPVGFYSATKHALRAFTDALHDELAGTKVGVSLITPGPVATEFRGKAAAYGAEEVLSAPTGVPVKHVARAIERSIRFRRVPGYRTIAVPRYLGIGRLAIMPGISSATRFVGHGYINRRAKASGRS